MSGRKITHETQKLGEKFQDGVWTGVPDAQGQQGGAIAGQFQRAFGARDAMDDEMRLRMQLADGRADGRTPFGQLQYTDKVGRWLQRKAQSAEEANFDGWFNRNFNKSNLADRQVAQALNPEFYSAREQFMRERTEAALRLKLIQLRGPQNEDDMYMLYLVETGRIELPEDWDRIGPVATNATVPAVMQQQLRERMFRLPKITGRARRSINADFNSQNGAWGSRAAANSSFANSPDLQFPGNGSSFGAGGTMGRFTTDYLGF